MSAAAPNNTASGIESVVGGGSGNEAAALRATVSGGTGNTANVAGSHVP